jgi:hypothetical protein
LAKSVYIYLNAIYMYCVGTLVYSLPGGDEEDEEEEEEEEDEEESRPLRTSSDASATKHSMDTKTMPIAIAGGAGPSPGYGTAVKPHKDKRHIHVHPMIHKPYRRPRSKSVPYMDSMCGDISDMISNDFVSGSAPSGGLRGVSSATHLLLEDRHDSMTRGQVMSYGTDSTNEQL